jgi:hypothetical protein
LQQLTQASEVPMYPVIENPNEKNVNKQEIKPKLRPSPLGDSAELSLVPDDLSGMYDYIPDVKSMSMGAYQEQLQSLNQTFEMLTNPQVLTMLQSEGVTPNVKDLIGSILEANGLRDTERYFKEAQASPGVQPDMAQPGLPGASSPPPPGGEQMAGPQAVQEPGGLPMGVPGVMGQGSGVQGANQAPPGF